MAVATPSETNNMKENRTYETKGTGNSSFGNGSYGNDNEDSRQQWQQGQQRPRRQSYDNGKDSVMIRNNQQESE